jgi:hypothetical protein
MNREDTLKSIDEAFADGVKHIYFVFVQGFSSGEPLNGLCERFGKGLASHCDAHGKTTAIVENYFKGFT